MKSVNTKPELLLRKSLLSLGLRYRLHIKELPGTPDICFIGKEVAVFVHGCYWHRHANCKLGKTNNQVSVDWIVKFNNIVKRDERVKKQLEDLGWSWHIAWECKIQENPLREAKKIQSLLASR